jgi:hypothetical protein
MRALAKANEHRLGRAKERIELRKAPAATIEAALLDPTNALASYSLSEILAPADRRGIVQRFGKASLNRVLLDLTLWNRRGRVWDGSVKYRDLTPSERRKFVDALRPYLQKAPKSPTPNKEAAQADSSSERSST